MPGPERRPTEPALIPPEASFDLERFYLEWFLPLVRRAIRRHGLRHEDAEELVQEAFVLALFKLDARRNPRAWLYQVVDHLAANFNRKRLRRSLLISKWTATPGDGSYRRAQGNPDD